MSKTPNENEYFFDGAFWSPRERWKQMTPGSRQISRRSRWIVLSTLALVAVVIVVVVTLSV